MKFLRMIFNRRVMAVLGLIALALIIWFVGPLVAIGEWRPLDSEIVRAIVIALVVLFFVARWAWRYFKAKQKNKALTEGIVAQAEEGPKGAAAAQAGSQEVAVLRQRFEEAVALLRESKKKKSGKLSSVIGGQFLYELPWYMFIGAPGSGKTTALVNSGLSFPLAEKFGQEAIAGVGGTRNCDWWFTDEAVLLDTAGRYTTQESDRDVDSAAWAGFLKLLSKYRPRRPINGALVTVSVADLLQQSAADAETHARALRARVQELHEQLNVRFPIYVLVSKTDLLPGFMEFFGELSREEREQVWGTTFDLADKGGNVLAEFNQRFEALEKRINDRLVDKLQHERDPQKRALLYVFPQHFSALKEPLGAFLSKVFAPSRFEEQPLVRGFYFTSGTQEGSPIDRIMGGLARALRLERRLVAPQRPTGKSFFITRLFNDVVFEESGIAGTNLKWERRRGLLQWGTIGLVALLSIGAITAWAVSYARNKAYIRDVDARIKAVNEQVANLRAAPSTDLVELLPSLRAVRQIAALPEASDGVPTSMTFGLYQGEKLDAAAQLAYRRLLQDVFLPRIAMRIEQRLRTGQQNIELLYEALKAYLMLSDPNHFDDKALKAFVTAEWEASMPRDVTVEQRRELETHLDNLLAMGGVSLPVQPDKELIAQSRDTIARIPIAQRIYNRLKHQGAGADLPEFTIAKAAGPSASTVFVRASGLPLTKGVPGFYSYDGYHKAFARAAEQVTAQLAQEEPWVLGLQQNVASQMADVANRGELMNAVRRLYLEEYARTWSQFVQDIKLVHPVDLQQSVVIARVLSSPDSPLPPLLRGIVKETTLGKEEGVPADKSVVDKASDAIRQKRDQLAKMFGQTPDASAAPGAPKIESIVDDQFAPLRRLVRAPAQGQPAPLDGTIALINEAYQQLVATQAAINSGNPPPPPSAVSAKIKAETGRLPEPVQSMLNTLSQSAVKQVAEKTRSNLSQSVTSSITEFCTKAIGGRYPFVKSSASDVTRDDFTRLFAPGGLLDDFFQKNLAQYVDTSSRPWKFRKVADASIPEASASLVQFQRAQTIRDVFFRGGQVPTIRLDMKPVGLDASITQVVIDVDGQQLKYAHGPQVPMSIQWPGPKGTQQVRVQVTPPGPGGGSSNMVFEGPWALLRLLDKAQLQPTNQPEKMLATFNLDGRKAQFEVISGSVQNPLRLPELEHFRCPGRL
jgi:type VI secretion system protein ImpL